MADKQALLVNFHNCLLHLCERLSPFFDAHGDLQLSWAIQELNTKHDISKNKFWNELTAPLKLLMDCERIYYDSSYLQQKKPREDQAIKYMYAQVPGGLKKIITALTKLISQVPRYETSLTDACQLLQQVCTLIQLRLTMISLYQSLAGIIRAPDYAELVKLSEKIHGKYEKTFTHPSMARLKAHLVSEISILEGIFRTELSIESYRFRESMLHLVSTRHLLVEWSHRCAKRRRLKTGDEKKHTTPAVIGWMSAFCAALLSKSSLYFYTLLREKSSEIREDVNARMDKLEMNYVTVLDRFVRRTGAYSLCLIYDANGMNHVIEAGQGYICYDAEQQHQIEPVQGLRAWPVIFTIPQNRPPPQHWNLISLIMANGEALGAGELIYEIVEARDPPNTTTPTPAPPTPTTTTPGSSFLVARIDTRMHICVIYPHAKKKQEPIAQEVVAIAQRLRHVTMYAQLQPKSKKK